MCVAGRLPWSKQLILAMSVVMWCGAALATEAGFQRLSATGIRATLIGKIVTDDSHWADRFLPDGVLDSHELGNVRRGAWTIEHGELCITRKARRPIKECFEIWTKGDQIEYRRDGVPVLEGMIRDNSM